MTYFKKTSLILIAFFVFALSHSQEKELVKKDSTIPVSIYSIPTFSNNYYSSYNLNSRLDLTSFQFLKFNKNSFEGGNFTVPFYKITQSPSEYIYDTYNKIYQYKVLNSAFFNVSDLYKVRPKNQY